MRSSVLASVGRFDATGHKTTLLSQLSFVQRRANGLLMSVQSGILLPAVGSTLGLLAPGLEISRGAMEYPLGELDCVQAGCSMAVAVAVLVGNAILRILIAN